MMESYRAEWFKLTRRPLVWILGGILVGMVVLIGYVFPYMTVMGAVKDLGKTDEINAIYEAMSGKNIGPWVFDFLARFGGAFAIALGAMTVGAEFGWNTMKTVLTQRGSRREALAGMLLALGVLIFAGIVLSMVAALGISFLLGFAAPTRGLPDPATLFPAMGAAWLTMAAWTAFGVVLASLFRSAAVGVSAGLVYVLGVEMLVGLAAPHVKLAELISKGLVGSNALVLARSLAAEGAEAAPAIVSEWHAIAVLVMSAAAAIAVVAALQRRDYA